jgi:hypothetical protein
MNSEEIFEVIAKTIVILVMVLILLMTFALTIKAFRWAFE